GGPSQQERSGIDGHGDGSAAERRQLSGRVSALPRDPQALPPAQREEGGLAELSGIVNYSYKESNCVQQMQWFLLHASELSYSHFTAQLRHNEAFSSCTLERFVEDVNR